MALPNDSFLQSPAGSGTALATQLIGGVEYPVVMIADSSGHLVQSLPSYTFFIKAVAGGAAKDHFDIFNASGSGVLLEFRGLWAMPAISGTAITGTISPDFDFLRTSAVGTGGTAIGYKSATFPSVSPVDTANANLPAQVTARVAPTGGATIAEALFSTYITQEETQAGAQLGQWFNCMPETTIGQRYAAREGQGFKLRQITAGAAQNFSFFGLFTLT
jgi:hypothetical protein